MQQHVKPILVVYINPYNCNQKDTIGLMKQLEKQLKNDYHLLLSSDFSINKIDFKLLSCKDIEEIEFEKLKEIVLNSLPQSSLPRQ